MRAGRSRCYTASARGSDVKQTWFLLINVACIAAVVAAVCVRVAGDWSRYGGRGRVALGAVAAFVLFLLVWMPGGPLGSEWARRSGTPASLLGGSAIDLITLGARR